MIVAGSHDPILVALSILIAIAASYVALDLADRIRASEGGPRRLWLSTAAVAMGGGIWSMHFVAMLALRLPGMGFAYAPGLTILSLLLAIGVTGAAFQIMSGWRGAPGRLAIAGLFMGSGVVGMHYVGMAAMRMDAALHYDRLWVVLSIAIAIGAATTALWLSTLDRSPLQRAGAAAVMGVAVSGMHYAAMQGAIFTAHAAMPAEKGSVGRIDLAIGVSAATALILIIALAAAALDRRFSASSSREARDTLRIQLADLMRDETSAWGLQRAATLLGRHFAVSRTGFGQLDAAEQVFDWEICWTDGTVPPLLGRHPASAFGNKIVAQLAEGTTVAIDDLLADPRSDEELVRQTASETDTRAILVVPYLREGRLRTILYLNDRNPRAWTADEIVLMEELAERTRQLVVRAEVEAELRQLNATLEARVQQRTAQLLEAEAALRQSQKMEAIGQLTGGIAHDFNNMLTGVIGNIDLLRRRLEAGRTDNLVRLLDAASGAADRAAALTARLLAFSRRQALDSRVVDVGKLLRNLGEFLRSSIGEMIRLSIDTPPTALHALVDPHQLENAILNLALNARDAMPEGGVLDIAVGAMEQESVGSNGLDLAPGHYVTIGVHDTGIGMSPDLLDRIVEPFFTTKPAGLGSGLGLSMVYGFAQQSGGQIHFASKEGAGTTVTLYLPAATSTAMVPSRPILPFAPGSGQTILLVEDDAAVRNLVALQLAELGYVATIAPTPDAALEILRSDQPVDLLLTDYGMPGMNGRDLADRARTLRPGIPVLIATGYADQAAERAAFLDADMALMTKPFTFDALADRLAGIFNSRG